jgi:hypothetical protein
MSTVTSKELVDEIIANDGHYMDDPRVQLITEYTNMIGVRECWGLDYDLPTRYYATEYVRDPKVIWRAGGKDQRNKGGS